MKWVYDAMCKLPPLKRKKNPGLAGILGFLLGGIGLGLYFWSLLDFAVPVLLAVLAGIIFSKLAAAGWIAGALVASGYGIFRAITSNAALEAKEQPASE